MVDLTGCAHLFGGEAALLAQVEEDCAAMGLSLRAAVVIGDMMGLVAEYARANGGLKPNFNAVFRRMSNAYSQIARSAFDQTTVKKDEPKLETV